MRKTVKTEMSRIEKMNCLYLQEKQIKERIIPKIERKFENSKVVLKKFSVPRSIIFAEFFLF